MAMENMPAIPHLIDPNMIAETIRMYFGIQLRPLDRPVYLKPYPEWVDRMMSLLKRFKSADCTTFSSKDGKSTIEHIGQYQLSVGKGTKMSTTSYSCSYSP